MVTTTNKHQILLASQSPRRRELLTLLGIPFEASVPNVVETPQANEAPADLVARLSQAKAHAACAEMNTPDAITTSDTLVASDAITTSDTLVASDAITISDAIIIACDTIVVLDGELMGKPRDAVEASAMLHRLREQPSHTVYSALTLLQPATGRSLTDVAQTQLTMRSYSDAEIATYVASGDPLDKAGAYAIQHPGFHPVAALQGCYANVIGLPLCHLTRCLRALGTKVPRDVPAACQTHTGRHCPVHATILDEK